ncbi:MAG: hypothetical protein AB3N23_00610 [Paracoccaceae bacterium]
MSAQVAVILWIVQGIALKVLMLWLDPKYRKAYGRWFTPGTEGLQMLRMFPVREIGWYAYMALTFVLMLRWLT